jgi:hypothetical protein
MHLLHNTDTALALMGFAIVGAVLIAIGVTK